MKPVKDGIRRAGPAELPRLMALFSEVKQGLHGIGLDQWPDHYPEEDKVLRDLANGHVHIIEIGGNIISSLTLNQEQDPAYQQIEWHIPAAAPFVVHRLVVHPAYWGQGMGRAWMHWAEDEVRRRGGGVIRLDTWIDNRASNALYQGLGYQQAQGYCYFYGPEKAFVCYEKAVPGTSNLPIFRTSNE